MSPAEIAELHRIALANTGDKEQARRLVEAYLAGRNRLLPLRLRKRHPTDVLKMEDTP